MQFAPDALPEPRDLARAQAIFAAMVAERFEGTPVRVKEYLRSGASPAPRIGKHVHLHLYAFEADEPLVLDPEFYPQGAWLTFDDFQARAGRAPCGLCTRLYSEYAVEQGLCEVPFAPAIAMLANEEV